MTLKTYAERANQYCFDVVSGTINTCNFVKLACQRHLNDLQKIDDPEYAYKFDESKANKRCSFSEKLPHVKGKWAGKKLQLEPHQIFIQCAIWGWVKKKDETRRFSIAYVEEPRKNGKSMDAATAALYMLALDGEKGAEIYSGATTEKQALEVFRPAWQMAKNTPDFLDKYGISLSGTMKNPTSIYRLADMSRFEPLVGNPGDGASPHCAIIDEYHEHKTSDQYDTMDTGMGSREQPLMFVITTAGMDTSTPCYDMHLKAVKVIEGTMEDDTFFAIIFTTDDGDDWKDYEVWKKANPNYGVSIKEDYLLRKYNETMTSAEKQNINLCKHLNKWTNAGVAWMNMVKWSACTDKSLSLEDFIGMPCWLGLDLASKIDICALILVFEYLNGFAAFGKYYLPKDTIELAGNEHYVKWVKEGYITETEGARTDFKYIEDDLKEINDSYPIQELAFDPKEATYLINNVMEWLGNEQCVEMNQGPALMSEPMKELEALIYSQNIWHNGDPVLTWMIGNVVLKPGRISGPVKYYYPTKAKKENKIDGATSLIMAVARAKLAQGNMSVYNERGVLVL